MFGMSIEREMVESFTGELGNMVAGNLCTILEKEGLILIFPPDRDDRNNEILRFQTGI